MEAFFDMQCSHLSSTWNTITYDFEKFLEDILERCLYSMVGWRTMLRRLTINVI